MLETSMSDERLSRITTIWSMIIQANPGSPSGDRDHLELLIERYRNAVYRYLIGAVRDSDVADELFQEFSLRFSNGKFRNADKTIGRFRDFLRTVLINLIHDFHRSQRRRLRSLSVKVLELVADSVEGVDLDATFLASWREELLDRTWRRLADIELKEGQPYFTVLQFRAANPEVKSAEMALKIGEQLQTTATFTESGIRKILQRGRERFAMALIDEVGLSLSSSDLLRIEEELIALDLHSYCKNALERRKSDK